MKTLSSLFGEHLSILNQRFIPILEKNALPGLVIAAGAPMLHYADDRSAYFYPTPHFAYWCPAQGPHHLLVIRPGEKTQVFLLRENDYWHEAPVAPEAFWAEHMTVELCHDKASLWKDLPAWKNFGYIGPEAELSGRHHQLLVNPPRLLANADWARAQKTAYEIHCLREANKKAALGHQAVRSAFASGASERQLHQLYVTTLGCTDDELPYHTIIGIDKFSSILHYQNKRDIRDGSVLLIDAGAKYYQYGSDITRTYARASAPESFRNLLGAMEALQQELCNAVSAGISFAELHEKCHILLAQVLLDQQLLKNCSIDEAIDRNLTFAFLPHGLGHMLGVQVHDVSGKQADEDGSPCIPVPRFPLLRTLRPLRDQDVVTIEPGLYFIPLLLEKMQQGELGRYGNFPLLAELIPYGGIRIEDDVVVGRASRENLTRQFLGNEFLL